MIYELVSYLAGVMVLVGATFSFLAVVGLLRLPDLYTRMHAASKAGTVGSGLCLIAVALVSLDGAVALRAVVALTFLMLTAPVSAHLLARAAYIAGFKPETPMEINELEGREVDLK